jgi:hypothetical protein
LESITARLRRIDDNTSAAFRDAGDGHVCAVAKITLGTRESRITIILNIHPTFITEETIFL